MLYRSKVHISNMLFSNTAIQMKIRTIVDVQQERETKGNAIENEVGMRQRK